MVTINDLVKEMRGRDYKISATTLKYYIDLGLMPKTEKQGGYKEGVKIHFPDKEKALNSLLKIFELKGKGYKLSEIKEQLRLDALKDEKYKTKKFFERYVEINSNFYYTVFDIFKGSVFDVVEFLDSDFFPSHRTISLNKELWIEGLKRVEEHQLFCPIRLYQNKPIFYKHDFYLIQDWIELRFEYDIEWNTLEAISKKYEANLEKYHYFPTPNEFRWTPAWQGHRKREMLNELGMKLVGYMTDLKEGFHYLNGEVSQNYEYQLIDDFIQDFLNEKCAFVPYTVFEADFLIKF